METHVTARRVDLLEEGLDFTLRGLGIANEAAGLIQRRLGTAKWLLAASPVWLARPRNTTAAERYALPALPATARRAGLAALRAGKRRD